MKHCFTILFLFVFSLSRGQLIDNFDDNSFPFDPDWVGDTADFIVNENGELQLAAAEAGTSTLLSATSIDADTISYSLRWRMDFSPSTSNSLKLYLSIDNTDLTLASGYYLEVGESGSDDAIRLFRLDAGVPTELAAGLTGAVANSPDINMRVDAMPNGLWVLNVDYDGGTLLEEDIVVMDSTYDPRGSSFFGWQCQYTSSRTDLFFFDDVKITPFERDVTPPSVFAVEIISSNELEVVYDEPVLSTAAELNTNYSIDPDAQLQSAQLQDPVTVLLTFVNEFPSDRPFHISISNISDENGNTMPETEVIELNYARIPQMGEVILNEILFASLLGGEDFIEIRNLSDDFLDLSGFILGNNTKTGSSAMKILSEGTTISPFGYLAFSEDKPLLEAAYESPSPENIVQQDIPDLNNDMGNVYIATGTGEVLDSYDYHEDDHYELLAVVKGVSLERVSPDLETSDKNNWTSASANTNFATPGYENSASLPGIQIEETFDFVQKVFSPDGDNIRDDMILGYKFDAPGYLGTVEVRDKRGYLIKRLATNESFSTEGVITWNGIDEEGKLANIGMYILVGEFYNLEGETLHLKKVCVLTGQI